MIDNPVPNAGGGCRIPYGKTCYETDTAYLFNCCRNLAVHHDRMTEPFSFIDASHTVVGLDIEIARHIARKLDMKLEVVNMDFGAMIPALAAGKVDMIGACITITGERAKKVLFSEPYYTGGIAALVRE